MDKVVMFAGAAGAAVLFVGCVDLAQTPYGSEEARWQQVIRENYSGYEAPRTAPPAVVDNVSPRLIEEEQLRKSQASEDAGAPAASDDPAAAVDKAADGSSAEVKNDPAPQAEEKAVEEKKADDKKADAGKKPADDRKADADKQAAAEKKAVKKEAVKGDVYEVVAGDSLGKIAQKFYGDARRFDIIVNANEQLKANPDKLRVGMKLVIPKI